MTVWGWVCVSTCTIMCMWQDYNGRFFCNGHYLPLHFVLYKPLMEHVMHITFFPLLFVSFCICLSLSLSLQHNPLERGWSHSSLHPQSQQHFRHARTADLPWEEVTLSLPPSLSPNLSTLPWEGSLSISISLSIPSLLFVVACMPRCDGVYCCKAKPKVKQRRPWPWCLKLPPSSSRSLEKKSLSPLSLSVSPSLPVCSHVCSRVFEPYCLHWGPSEGVQGLCWCWWAHREREDNLVKIRKSKWEENPWRRRRKR